MAVSDGALHIELTVPERVVSLHGANVTVPLEHIRGVRIVRDVLTQLRGLRMPGLGFPGTAAIGVWRGTADGQAFRDFVLVRRPGRGLVISTRGEYDRVVLGSDEPEQLAAQLDGPAPSA